MGKTNAFPKEGIAHKTKGQSKDCRANGPVQAAE